MILFYTLKKLFFFLYSIQHVYFTIITFRLAADVKSNRNAYIDSSCRAY